MKAIVSCIGKFHAFALAEQLQQYQTLASLYTCYAWQKNRLMRRFAGRVDLEKIEPRFIRTHLPIAVLKKALGLEYYLNDWFDRWVAQSIARRDDYEVFIGWSGMSLHSVRAAKQGGKTVILERGSSHIEYQEAILKEEYQKFDLDFSIDPRTVEKELKEYEASDFISVPSDFAKRSFVERGVSEKKLIVNPYGSSVFFRPAPVLKKTANRPFRILYLGGLTVQKGLVYLFEALRQLSISVEHFEVWFVGSISDEIRLSADSNTQPNWFFKGHVLHYDLPALISQCDIAVQPSLQEGLSMVIPQMLGCGIPVIATTNTGGENIIQDGETGFIVPIRSPEAIREKIHFLYRNPKKLAEMKHNAAESVNKGFTWDDYGERYITFLNSLTQ